MAMNTGTIALNAEAGRVSSRTAPMIPPETDAVGKPRSARPPWPGSSRRKPTAPLAEPGTRPIVFDTFAVTGG